MNKAILIGRLVADPILTTTSIDIAKFTLAVSDSYKKETSYFFDCVSFGNQAKYVSQYLHKGDLISIDGRITIDSYVNKEGKNVSKCVIHIETVNTLHRANSNNANANNGGDYNKPADNNGAPKKFIAWGNKANTDTSSNEPEVVTKDFTDDNDPFEGN